MPSTTQPAHPSLARFLPWLASYGPRDARNDALAGTPVTVPGVIVFRCNAALLYFNVDNVHQHMVRILERAPAPLRRIVIDMAFTIDLDLSTVRVLTDFARRAAEDGVAVHLADAHHRVRAILARENCGALLGDLTRSISIAELVDGLAFDLPAPALALALAPSVR